MLSTDSVLNLRFRLTADLVQSDRQSAGLMLPDRQSTGLMQPASQTADLMQPDRQSVIEVPGVENYYKLAIGREADNQLVTTTKLKRRVYKHPKYENCVLVEYIGNSELAVPIPRGTAKSRKALKRPFKQTTSSLREKIAKMSGTLSIVCRELELQAPAELLRHIVGKGGTFC